MCVSDIFTETSCFHVNNKIIFHSFIEIKNKITAWAVALSCYISPVSYTHLTLPTIYSV